VRNTTGLAHKTTGLPKDLNSWQPGFFYFPLGRTGVGIMMAHFQKQLRVLVIDPSKSELCMMMSVLSERNCDVGTAQDLEGGLRLAKGQRPDLLIVDHGLRLDGIELCRRVRQDPELSDVPIVVMTSYAPHSNLAGMVGLFEAGCDQLLGKPFKPRDLHAAIQSALLREEHARLIPVMYRTGETTLVCPDHLDQLIVGGMIVCFRRRDDVAVIGRDKVRMTSSGDYCGVERRCSP
jgi:CheY-like chemotaxis protein